MKISSTSTPQFRRPKCLENYSPLWRLAQLPPHFFPRPLLTRAHAQEQAAPPAALPSQLIANLEKLRAAALSSDYAWKELAHLTENIGPRLTGSPQATEAANYVAGEMRQLGLDVKLEKTMVPHWVRGEERAELTVYPGQAPHTTQRIVLTALGNSPATPPDGLSAEVVVVNNFDELTALGREKVAGRIVLFNEMYDKQLAAAGMSFPAYGAAVQYRVLGAQAAAKLGAVAVLVRSVGDADYRLPHTGQSIAAGIPVPPSPRKMQTPSPTLSRKAESRCISFSLRRRFRKSPATTSSPISKAPNIPSKSSLFPAISILGDLGTGAIDDGAGVVVAMQVANLCKQLGRHPARTLRIIAWMDEENGGSGSKTYNSEHSSDFANHVAAIESDSGAAHPLGFGTSSSPAAIAMLQPAMRVLAINRLCAKFPNGEGGSDLEGCKKPASPFSDSCKMAASIFTTTTPQPTRSTKSSRTNSPKTLPLSRSSPTRSRHARKVAALTMVLTLP